MRISIHAGALLVAALATGLPARAARGATPAPSASPRAALQEEDPEERYDALVEDFNDFYQSWRADIRAQIEKARADNAPMPAIPMRPPVGPFVERFQAAAADYAGTDGAVPFLIWIVEIGSSAGPEAAKQSLQLLLSTHIESERLAELGEGLPQLVSILGEGSLESLCQRLEKDAGSRELRAWACYHRQTPVLTTAAIDSKEYAAAKAELVARLAEVKDERVKGRISSSLREREAFAIGMVAPDIVGIDLDGTAFKLSDYKGKVLFVDFWGDW